jgi:hypothetical protein
MATAGCGSSSRERVAERRRLDVFASDLDVFGLSAGITF